MVTSREGTISGGNQAAAGQADRFAHAWHSLRNDASIQFNLAPPRAPLKPPEWLRDLLNALGKALEPIARFLKWLASFLPDAAYARILLWLVIVLGAAGVLWAVYNRIRTGEWHIRLRGGTRSEETDQEWVPDQADARSWLDEADALASEGLFAEAAHHLLFRSIEDISNRRPTLVRPALTSRELASSQSIPDRARQLFAGIASLVERSRFGKRPVSEADWLKARDTYFNFARPVAWRA